MAVVGTSCSGKTTLARRLAERLGAPHVELDALNWGPDWTECTPDVFRDRVRRAVAAPRWICDGNYGRVRDLVWGRATALVWLDYPFPVIGWRALTRTLRRSLGREVLYGGNRESLVRAFLTRDSILLWVLRTWRGRRARYGALFAADETAHLHRIRLRRPREAERLLAELARRGSAG